MVFLRQYRRSTEPTLVGLRDGRSELLSLQEQKYSKQRME